MTQPRASMPVKLLKDLVALSKNKDGLNVLTNVVIAALHIACMLKGTADSADRLVSLFIPTLIVSLFTPLELGRSKLTL